LLELFGSELKSWEQREPRVEKILRSWV